MAGRSRVRAKPPCAPVYTGSNITVVNSAVAGPKITVLNRSFSCSRASRCPSCPACGEPATFHLVKKVNSIWEDPDFAERA